MTKSPDAFRTISEVAEDLDLPQHVLRFWETRFSQIRPMKRTGGRRYYRPEDIDLLRAIRALLYGQGYTIKGVQRILKEQGARGVISAHASGAAPPRPAAEPEEGPAETPVAQSSFGFADAPADAGVAPVIVHAPSPAQLEEMARLARDIAECARLLRAARE